MIEVLDIGDRVETGSYQLHSRFRGALAFIGQASGRLVCAVDETKCAGPWNIVTRGLDFAHVDSLAVEDRVVRVDGRCIPIGRRSDSRLQPAAIDAVCLRQNIEAMWATLLECAPRRSIVRLLTEAPAAAFDGALADRFRTATARLAEGDVSAAQQIRGLGPGLTPAGDDFLAGYLLGLYVLGDEFAVQRRQIREMALTSNPFSTAMLDCAVEGRAIAPALALIASLWRRHSWLPHRDSSRCAIRRLCQFGASSGADCACGLYFSLKSHLKEPT